MKISTERSVLVTPELSDAYKIQHFLLANRAHLAPWEPERSADYWELEQIEARINQWQNERRNGSGLCFIIYNVERTEVIGSCHFSIIVYGPFRACHLGFSLSQAHQGQGFMYEALNAAITHVYEQLGLHRIMANYMPSNMRSGALLSRLGFVKEGLAPSYLKIAGRWQDHVLTSKLNPKEENDS